MLESLTLVNWKSFGERRNRLDLAPLTLIVGPNGSGKSNALDALRFLQGAALDYPLGDVLRGRWEGQREVWPPVRGQAAEAARTTTLGFELASTWSWTAPSLEKEKLEHVIAVNPHTEVLLDAERVTRPEADYAFDTQAPTLRGAAGRQEDGAIRAALRSEGRGNSVIRSFSAARSLLHQVGASDRVAPSCLEDAERVRSALRGIIFLEIMPGRMRDYRPEYAQVLGTSGENISPMLKSLAPSQLQDVVDWLGELSAPKLSEIAFDSTALREVMFFLREGASTQISARSVSDGTLRFLGLVTALLTAEAGSLIVIEEPDVGLHPARIHLLARLLEQVTQDGRIQVVATTHSPTLLAHLSPQSLADVVALRRDEDGLSVCERLGNLDHFAALRDSHELEHLDSLGWIERAMASSSESV